MAVRRVFVLVACVLPCVAGAAEPAAPSASGTWQHVSLTWTHAIAFGGPGSSLEAAMRSEGFDDTYLLCAGAWQPCNEDPWTHPDTTSSRDLYATWAARARVQLTPRLGVGLSFCRSPLQETDGYRADPAGEQTGDFVFVSSRATTVAVVFSVGRGDLAWAGLGPSLNFLTLESEGGLSLPSASATAFGAVLEAGVRYPPRSRVFFEAAAQYRYVAPVHLTPPGLGRAYDIGFRHAAIMAGIGARFGTTPPRP